jgi:hypothetical protein
VSYFISQQQQRSKMATAVSQSSLGAAPSSLRGHPGEDINRVPDAAILEQHHALAAKQGGAAMLRNKEILTLTLPQAEAMWAKFEARLLRDFHGVAGLPSEQACWVLPKVQASPAAKYVRRHEGVKERRGPYQKVGYSHTSGGYAQTTYTQSDHRALGLPKDSATSMAPLRSAHTRRHACSERHFRLSVVVVVSSFA